VPILRWWVGTSGKPKGVTFGGIWRCGLFPDYFGISCRGNVSASDTDIARSASPSHQYARTTIAGTASSSSSCSVRAASTSFRDRAPPPTTDRHDRTDAANVCVSSLHRPRQRQQQLYNPRISIPPTNTGARRLSVRLPVITYRVTGGGAISLLSSFPFSSRCI